MTPSLSALIIAKDEEKDLPGCLASLEGLADEIVVLVDDATIDRTEEIARKAGCKVARRRFDDYARQRQAALELCTKEWVLWIDCDERLSPQLRSGLEPYTRLIDAAGWTSSLLRFEVHFLGRGMRFGGLGREKHRRLFRRTAAQFVGGQLHEGIEVKGTCCPDTDGLAGVVIHTPYRDIDDYMSKLERYTTLSAQKKFEAGKRFRPWHHLAGPWDFFSRAILRLGFLDGKAGLTWAWLSARHSALKYAKLRDLESRK